jgi:uncharacterized Zn-binding protein involved in type VI secretion
MSGVSRVGVDNAGGMITGNRATTVFVNGSNICVLGASVASHGLNEHSAPVMAQSSRNIYAHGIGVCRRGDSASCGHVATGSQNVFANDN